MKKPFMQILIESIFLLSPYKWIDNSIKLLERFPASRTNKNIVTSLRYTFSDTYIIGWVFIGIFTLIFHAQMPNFMIVLFSLRIFGILNKELGVVLFKTCKITIGDKVSISHRVILLALTNYISVALLFAFIYIKQGLFEIGGKQSALNYQQAFIHSFSIQFSSPSFFKASTEATRLIILSQQIFCFLFITMVLSLFIPLIAITATSNKTD